MNSLTVATLLIAFALTGIGCIMGILIACLCASAHRDPIPPNAEDKDQIFEP